MLVVCCSLFVIVYCLCFVVCLFFLALAIKRTGGGLGGHLGDASTLPVARMSCLEKDRDARKAKTAKAKEAIEATTMTEKHSCTV